MKISDYNITKNDYDNCESVSFVRKGKMVPYMDSTVFNTITTIFENVVNNCRNLVSPLINNTTIYDSKTKTLAEAEYDILEDIIRVDTSKIFTKDRLEFALIHEMRHAEQARKGFLKLDIYNNEFKGIIWKGTKFPAASIILSDFVAYNNLPWEMDANAYAVEVTGYTHECFKQIKLERAF